ncbi:hypothetical protein ACSX1A_03965 [Pontibacter sp. MBLB2868]|uniref:hypothetical protein n=1 Tax=Pontibacter sp. MBLB2868 TaxID=3451555 RepID=UPI003F751D3B
MSAKRLFLIAGLSLSVITFSSCTKEEVLPASTGIPTTGNPSTPPPVTPPPTNQTPPPVSNSSMLKQMGTRVFKYDTQNRLTEVDYTDQITLGYTVVYEGDKPAKLIFKNGNYLLYTYSGDKVVEAVRYYRENKVNYRYTFAYTGDKLVKMTTLSYATSDEGRLGITEYKYNASGNMTELATSWSTSNRIQDLGPASIIRWGSFDSNPNPVPFAESSYYLPGVKLFSNNPGFRDAGSGKEFYTYAYHSSGMPVERSTRLEAYPGAGPFIERYAY